MMLNDFVTIGPPGDMIAGTDRSKALKDGNFTVLSQLACDPEHNQKNFLSVLSRLGAGLVQTTTEDAKSSNLKLAEGLLPDEENAEDTTAGKPKEKQGKDCRVVKRLTTACPDALGLVMGFLSVPDPPLSILSADTALHAPGIENDEGIDSASAAGEALPDAMADEGLSGKRNLRAGNLSILPPLPEETGRIQVVQNKGRQKEDGQRTGTASVPEQLSSALEFVPAVGINVSQPFQGRQKPGAVIVPESASVLKADLSDMVRVQAVPTKGLPKETGQRPEPSLPMELVSSEHALVPAKDIKGLPVFQGRLDQGSGMVPESELVLQADLSETGQAKSVPEYGLTREREERSEPLSTPVSDLSDTGLAKTNDVKVSRLFQRYLQTDAVKISVSERVSTADLSDIDRVQAVPAEVTPELRRQQRRDSLTIPDKDTLNPVAGKNYSDVKGETPQRLSEGKSTDGSTSEKTPTDPNNDPGRHDAVKRESTSFVFAKDSVETSGMSVTSSGASNSGDYETSKMFLPANHSAGAGEGDEDNTHFPLPEPESADLSVNFSRQAPVDKASWVISSAVESPVEGQQFHAEVLKQIVDKTSADLKSGRSEIRIDLKPEALGHLRLHVSIDQQQVTVKILAENTQVKEMIENQASLIKNELQQQGIHVNTVKVDMLMSGGSDFAYSQNESSAFKQTRQEPAYGGSKDKMDVSASHEPDLLNPPGNRGGSLVNYFA